MSSDEDSLSGDDDSIFDDSDSISDLIRCDGFDEPPDLKWVFQAQSNRGAHVFKGLSSRVASQEKQLIGSTSATSPASSSTPKATSELLWQEPTSRF